MIPAYVIEMLQLQNKMNCKINPDWIGSDIPWSRAILVETVELMDHIGWKWWKKQPYDRTQAVYELVDIWHFILSQTLDEEEGNVQKATLTICEEWDLPLTNVFVSNGTERLQIATLPLIRRIELFGSLCGLTGQPLITVYRNICEEVGLSFSSLYAHYVSKNTLNMFRQDHGYQDGSYIKVWNGREDNEVLGELMADNPALSPSQLYTALERRYAEVPHVSVQAKGVGPVVG